MSANQSMTETQLDALARRRAGARLGWYVHAFVFVLVQAGLLAAALVAGRNWILAPSLGWGLGLAIHGLVVWTASPRAMLFDRLLQQERERLQPQRDPW